MPQFPPGAAKTARASVTVSPAGLNCALELYLVQDSTKMTTSGLRTFVSTGAPQEVLLPIAMPSAAGVYPVWLDAYAEGVLFLEYVATEDVEVVSEAQVSTLLPVADGFYDDGLWTLYNAPTKWQALSDNNGGSGIRGNVLHPGVYSCVIDSLPWNAPIQKVVLRQLQAGSANQGAYDIFYRHNGVDTLLMRWIGWSTMQYWYDTEFPTNPATGLPWTKGDLTNAEIVLSLIYYTSGTVMIAELHLVVHPG